MMTPEEFTQRWGAGLVSVPPALVQAVLIPSPAKEFLALAGLPGQAPIPTGGAGGFASLPVGLPSDRQEYPRYPLLSRYAETPYLLLGYLKFEPYYGVETYFGVEEKTGKIGMVDSDPGFLYINSSVPDFAGALLEFRDYMEFAEQHCDEHPKRVRRRLAELAQSLGQADPNAFSNRDYFWPMMLDDFATTLS